MSRTIRSNPTSKHEEFVFYVDGERCEHRLSNGGWKEAKKVLPKEDYAQARSCRGDKLTGYAQNGGVPHWFRNELERQHRRHTRRELHRYIRNAEYEPMVCESPSGDEWYYW